MPVKMWPSDNIIIGTSEETKDQLNSKILKYFRWLTAEIWYHLTQNEILLISAILHQSSFFIKLIFHFTRIPNNKTVTRAHPPWFSKLNQNFDIALFKFRNIFFLWNLTSFCVFFSSLSHPINILRKREPFKNRIFFLNEDEFRKIYFNWLHRFNGISLEK